MRIRSAFALVAAAVAAASLAPRAARAHDLDPGFGMHAGATFRGDEIGARDFGISEDDLMTIFSYFHPYRERRLWEQAANGVRGTVGSTASDEFYVDNQARIGVTAWDRFTLRYRYVHDEDFDSQYVRHLVEGEIRIWDGLYFAAGTEPLAEKGTIDLDLGLGWRDPGGFHARLDWIQADWVANKKGRDFKYDEEPHTFMARASVPLGGAASVGAFVESSPRLVRRSRGERVRDPYRFRFEKHRIGLRGDLDLGAAGAGGFRVLLERMRKETVLTEPGADDALDEEDPLGTVLVERRAALAEALWSIPVRGGKDEVELGLFGAYLREPNDFLRDDRDFHLVTRQVFAKVRYAWLVPVDAFKESVRFAPALLVGHVTYLDVHPGEGERTDRFHGVQAKVNGAIEFFPTPSFHVVIMPTLRLDEPEFGGGDVQVVITF